MESFEASPVASNFSIVLKPTSKIVLNLSRDQNNLKKLSLDLIFNLSSNRKLRPVKWPLTFQQFASWPQTIFLITCQRPWISCLTYPQPCCKLHTSFSTEEPQILSWGCLIRKIFGTSENKFRDFCKNLTN